MAKANDLYVDVAAGQYLFREGDAGAEMYIIESGSIAILRTARGNEPLAVLEPGDFLGEMAILEDQPRFASALVRTDARLLRIERGAFAELLRQNVEIAVRIMRKLALRQRRAELRVSELQKEVQALREAAVRVPVQAAAVASAPAVPAAVAVAPEVPPAAPVVAPAPVAAVAVPPPVVAPPAAVAVPAPVIAPAAVVAAAPVVVAASNPASVAAPVPAAAPPAVPASAGLVLLHAASGQRFALEPGREEFLVGRVDPVTGITPEINLGPLDTARTLSRRHAKLLRQGALLFLREEVGTANGTFLNGQRLATGAAVAVKPGDRLRFGTIEIELTAS